MVCCIIPNLLQIEVPDYSLVVIPGYDSSIRQHEQGILMCADIITKVMRRDNVLHLLTQCSNEGGNFQVQ